MYKSVVSRPLVRAFSVSATAMAKPKPVKVKQKAPTFKAKPAAEKVAKKGGMTHLRFRDAVRALGFDKQASDISHVDELSFRSDGVARYAPATREALETLDSFKKFQHHETFREPITLVNSNTTEIKKFLSNFDKSSKENRVCITGEKGSGKSTLLTQAQALALSQGDVIVIHLDHPEKIVNGTSDYVYNKKLEKYQQPMFTKRWIRKIRDANKDTLQKLKLSRDISFTTKKKEYDLKAGQSTVYEFLLHNHDFGVVGPTGAFQFFIEELVHHSAQVPVLVTIDNINALTGNTLTRYHHPDFRHIHFTELEAGALIRDLVSGSLAFNKGGVLLAESNDNPASKTLPVGLGLEPYNPYWKASECDREVAEAFLSNGGVKNYSIKPFSKQETESLLEFYREAGALQVRPYPSANQPEEFDAEHQFSNIVNNTYLVSSGNPGFVVQAANISY